MANVIVLLRRKILKAVDKRWVELGVGPKEDGSTLDCGEEGVGVFGVTGCYTSPLF